MKTYNFHLSIPHRNDPSLECEYCGQRRLKGKYCEQCLSSMYGFVFAATRKFLNTNGKSVSQPDLRNNRSAIRYITHREQIQIPNKEFSLATFLDQFPIELVRACFHSVKILKEDGLWFSHLLAYRTVMNQFQHRRISIGEIIRHLQYLKIREEVLQFLENKDQDSIEERYESVKPYYCDEHSNLDAKHVIFEMLCQLDKNGLAHINLHQNACKICGTHVPQHTHICSKCLLQQYQNSQNIFHREPPINNENNESSNPAHNSVNKGTKNVRMYTRNIVLHN